MAITSPSQMLNLTSVQSAVNILDTTIAHLNSAKSALSNAVKYCDEEALETNEGNTFPTRIKELQDRIDARISEVKSLKSNVMEKARRIRQSEEYEYQRYLDRLRQEEEAAKAAAAKAASAASAQAVAK